MEDDLKLIKDEANKLIAQLDHSRKRVKDLDEENLKISADASSKISSLEEEVERLNVMNALMWRRWKDFILNHSEHPNAHDWYP